MCKWPTPGVHIQRYQQQARQTRSFLVADSVRRPFAFTCVPRFLILWTPSHRNTRPSGALQTSVVYHTCLVVALPLSVEYATAHAVSAATFPIKMPSLPGRKSPVVQVNVASNLQFQLNQRISLHNQCVRFEMGCAFSNTRNKDKCTQGREGWQSPTQSDAQQKLERDTETGTGTKHIRACNAG